MTKPSIERLRFCNFKLRTLLNITQTINTNLPTEELLATFEHILSEELNIGRFLLFSNIGKKWDKMLHYGIKENDYDKIDIEKDLLPINNIEITIGEENDAFKNFDFVIPILKNEKIIAYILMGDIDNKQIGISPSLRHLQFIQTLTNIILVAIQNKELVRKSVIQERIKKELEMAANIQATLVPSTDSISNLEEVKIKPFYMSHFEVGGDLYDFGHISKNEVFFCIADVSGKGISAAMLMSNFQANLRAQIRTNFSLTHVVKSLNKNVLKVSKGELFVTMFLAKYNIENQRFIYINAGHLPPVLYDSKTEKLRSLTYGCSGIGMLDEIPQINVGTIEIKSYSKLLCFTDGLSEYSIDGKEDYGLDIVNKAMLKKDLDINKTIDYIIKKLDLNKENINILDDITMLGVEFKSVKN